MRTASPGVGGGTKKRLAAQITERETHLRANAGRELMRRRAEQLAAEIEIGETKLTDLRSQRDALIAELG